MLCPSEVPGRRGGKGLQECVRLGTTALGDIAQPAGRRRLSMPRRLRARFSRDYRPDWSARGSGPGTGPATSACGKWRVPIGKPASARTRPTACIPDLLAGAVALSAAGQTPLAFHLAESREEMELLHSGGGPLREMLDALGAWEPGAIHPGTRPLEFLQLLSRAHRALVIHGNYLDDREIEFLARHARRMAVVYCPRTHAWFDHPPYPLEKMLAAGAEVALGTDSRASSPDLSVLAEMRAAVARHPAVSPAVVLRVGDVAGGRGSGPRAGDRQPGAWKTGQPGRRGPAPARGGRSLRVAVRLGPAGSENVLSRGGVMPLVDQWNASCRKHPHQTVGF